MDAFNNALGELDDKEEKEKLVTQIKERIAEYAEDGYPMKPYQAWIGPKVRDQWEGPWALHIGLGEIVDMLHSGLSGDDEYGGDEHYHEYLNWRHDGIDVDYEHLSERRNEKYGDSGHLTDHDEKDPLAVRVEERDLDIDVARMAPRVAYELAQILRVRESKGEKVTFETLVEEAFDEDFDDIIRLALSE